MKILFYNHTGQVSGAEYLLLMVLARLDRNRFSPVVVCPKEGPLLAKLKELSIPAETVAGLNARFTMRPDYLLRYLLSFWLVIRDLRNKVVSSQPDVIHANSIRAGLVATIATLSLQTKVVWHLHDLLPPHPFSILIRTIACLASRSRMIAVSRSVADNFVGRFSTLRSRVQVILNGIDLEKFYSSPVIDDRIREELEIAPTDFVIGIVGQLTPRKGQLALVRAFAKVLRELPDSVLVIVGAALFNRDQDYADSIKESAVALGVADRIRLTGARSDVAAVMQSVDLLVVNSTIEPFGLVALEAMACERPVLAAISGGIPELIKHGENGWLVAQGDENALVEAMVRLGRDPKLRTRLAAAGKQVVTSNFSVERYQADLHEFYLSLDESTNKVAEDAANRQTKVAKFA